MTNFNLKIFGASLSALAFSLTIPNVMAQTCVVPPTCEELGFIKTENDCLGRTILKCPFNKAMVFCAMLEESGAEIEAPKIGDILYSDMTWSTTLDTKRTPIGIIFEPTERRAIALKDLTGTYAWGSETNPVNEVLINTENASGKTNTQKIIAYGKENGKSFPAAEACYSYSFSTTKTGSWFLPSRDEWTSIISAKTKINNVLSTLSSSAAANTGALNSTHYYTSTEATATRAYYTFSNSLVATGKDNIKDCSFGLSSYGNNKNCPTTVRCAIQF